jgi:hypothetical protein
MIGPTVCAGIGLRCLGGVSKSPPSDFGDGAIKSARLAEGRPLEGNAQQEIE